MRSIDVTLSTNNNPDIITYDDLVRSSLHNSSTDDPHSIDTPLVSTAVDMFTPKPKKVLNRYKSQNVIPKIKDSEERRFKPFPQK
jgi:hypothetical protein